MPRKTDGIDLPIQHYRERTRKPQPNLISKFARVDRIEKVMRRYPEAVL